MTRRVISVLGIAAVLFSFSGCSRKPAQQTLNVYIWSEYLPDDVAKRFTERTGIKLVFEYFPSNEILLQKLKSGVADYDIVVPSDYMVHTLIAEKLVQPLDRSKLTNFGNLDPQFLGQSYDPKNEYSVPYLWGMTVLAYDKTHVQGTVDSWDVLFDERYSGQICMLDDARECFAVELKRMGKSLNETDPKVLAEAAAALKKQRTLVKAYDSEDFGNKLVSGDAWLVHGYSGQLAKVARQDAQRRFVVTMPKQGGTKAIDNLCIPASSKRSEAAMKFINFCLEPQNAADIINGTGYAGANQAAKPLIKPEILNDPAVYPPADVLNRCESIRQLGESAPAYDKLWGEIKGG